MDGKQNGRGSALAEATQLTKELQSIKARELKLIEAPAKPGVKALGAEEKHQQRTGLEANLAAAVEHFSLGSEAVELEDWEGALKHFEASLTERRTLVVTTSLADVYQNMSRFNDALELYSAAEQLCKEQGLPVDPYLPMNRGDVLLNLGRDDDALEAYIEAKGLRREQGIPDDPYQSMNCGVALRSLGRYAEALAAYDEAEALRKNQGMSADPGLSTNRGVIYWNMGRLEEALAAYEKAEALREEIGLPDDPVTTFNRAHIHKSMGDMAMACELARQAQEMFERMELPVHPNILNFIANNCDGELGERD